MTRAQTNWREPKRIVVPVDFSEASVTAIDVASDLAIHFASPIELLHAVVPREVLTETLGALEVRPADDLLDDARDRLASLAPATTPTPLETMAILVQRSAANAIVAHLRPTDLVVLTSTGRTEVDKLGSTAHDVVKNSPCPVLVLPD